MAGQKGQGVARGLVGGHQPAEGDVVAGGVLDTGQDALLAQLDEQVATELRAAEAHGDVVGEDGDVDGRGDGAEVGLDLLRVVERVERAGGHDRLGAQGGCPTSLVNDPVGGGVDGTGEHRDASCRSLDDPLDDGVALGVGEVSDLSGGPQGEQAVDTTGDEVLDDLVQAVEVNLARGGERGDDRRDDAGETVVHCGDSLH